CHVPGSAVSVRPTRASPEIVGGDVFVGALDWLDGDTTPEAPESAKPEPRFVSSPARTRSVWPTSPAARRYVSPLATLAQALPDRSHRRQTIEWLDLPSSPGVSHLPRSARTTAPWTSLPSTLGGATFLGAVAGASLIV